VLLLRQTALSKPLPGAALLEPQAVSLASRQAQATCCHGCKGRGSHCPAACPLLSLLFLQLAPPAAWLWLRNKPTQKSSAISSFTQGEEPLKWKVTGSAGQRRVPKAQQTSQDYAALKRKASIY